MKPQSLAVCGSPFGAMLAIPLHGQTADNPANLPQRDGSHDFDFLVATGRPTFAACRSASTVPTSGWNTAASRTTIKFRTAMQTSSSAVISTDKKPHIKAQTLRLYNPVSHQWSIYLVDIDNRTLGLPPVIGWFTGNRGEFFDEAQYKGRAMLMRQVWLNLSPYLCGWQLFSPDGGKAREVNWIASCRDSRVAIAAHADPPPLRHPRCRLVLQYRRSVCSDGGTPGWRLHAHPVPE